MFVKKQLLLFTLCLVTFGLSAQSSTVSPYSRYGYGDMHSGNFIIANSMGGVGYGVRNNTRINPKNPASFSIVDSLTFMMDIGLSANFNQFTSSLAQQQKSSGQFDYVAFKIPITRNIGASVGLLPFSSIGYQYAFDEKIIFNSEELLTNHSFVGAGGVNRLYGGLAYSILPAWSVGVNANYLFGNSHHTRSLTFPNNSTYTPTKEETNLYISTLYFDFGTQISLPINKKDLFTIGGTYTMKTPMGIRSEITTTGTQVTTDNTSYSFEYPQSIGVGFSYFFNKKLLIAADFTQQYFSDALFYSKKDSLSDLSKIALGLEYIPNSNSRKYGETIRYRVGGNYGQSYTFVNENQFNELGVSLGFGFPLKNSKSFINLMFEYGSRGNVTQNLVREEYFKIGFGLSVQESWFFKRKFE